MRGSPGAGEWEAPATERAPAGQSITAFSLHSNEAENDIMCNGIAAWSGGVVVLGHVTVNTRPSRGFEVNEGNGNRAKDGNVFGPGSMR